MRGTKPKQHNVIPMRPDDVETEKRRKAAVRRAINALRPKGLPATVEAEYRRVAKILAAPTVDRLKPQYIDTITEYCRVCVRLRDLRAAMPTLNLEVYRVKTRNGDQVKSHPYVAQINESWRQWHSLAGDLGLSPAAERGFLPGQGDLFDEINKYFD